MAIWMVALHADFLGGLASDSEVIWAVIPRLIHTNFYGDLDSDFI